MIYGLLKSVFFFFSFSCIAFSFLYSVTSKKMAQASHVRKMLVWSPYAQRRASRLNLGQLRGISICIPTCDDVCLLNKQSLLEDIFSISHDGKYTICRNAGLSYSLIIPPRCIHRQEYQSWDEFCHQEKP